MKLNSEDNCWIAQMCNKYNCSWSHIYNSLYSGARTIYLSSHETFDLEIINDEEIIKHITFEYVGRRIIRHGVMQEIIFGERGNSLYLRLKSIIQSILRSEYNKTMS